MALTPSFLLLREMHQFMDSSIQNLLHNYTNFFQILQNAKQITPYIFLLQPTFPSQLFIFFLLTSKTKRYVKEEKVSPQSLWNYLMANMLCCHNPSYSSSKEL